MTDGHMPNNVVYLSKGRRHPTDDDYGARMRQNLAAVAFISIFLFASCWIIDTLMSVANGL